MLLKGLYKVEFETPRRKAVGVLFAENGKLLGVIHLKDVVKGGIRERFAQLRKMGVRTVMITGDNQLTAAAIAAESRGYLAEIEVPGADGATLPFNRRNFWFHSGCFSLLCDAVCHLWRLYGKKWHWPVVHGLCAVHHRWQRRRTG